MKYTVAYSLAIGQSVCFAVSTLGEDNDQEETLTDITSALAAMHKVTVADVEILYVAQGANNNILGAMKP
jgi:hypothetical protein